MSADDNGLRITNSYEGAPSEPWPTQPDRRAPAPGVYNADQGHTCQEAVEAALRGHDESMEDRLARLRHVHRQRDNALLELDALRRELEVVRVQRDRAERVAAERGELLDDQERTLRQVTEERNEARADADR